MYIQLVECNSYGDRQLHFERVATVIVYGKRSEPSSNRGWVFAAKNPLEVAGCGCIELRRQSGCRDTVSVAQVTRTRKFTLALSVRLGPVDERNFHSYRRLWSLQLWEKRDTAHETAQVGPGIRLVNVRER